jgi:hypothetical protein
MNRLSRLFGFRPQANRVLVGTHHKGGTVWMKDIFSAVCAHLSLAFYGGKQRMSELVQIAFDGSLFSNGMTSGHVRSGQPRQWPSYFTKSLHRQFLEHFGDALIRLGYEQNDQWCP